MTNSQQFFTLQALGGHRRVVVMGLGLFGGGVGAARFWARLGAEVTVTDLRSSDILAPSVESLKDLNIRFVLGRHDENDFCQADLVMVNPGVSYDNHFVRLARAHSAAILTEVGLVLRIHHGPVLAVTGTNGKSTTAALIGKIIQASDPDCKVGGNLGGSLLDALPNHRPSAPLVVELSSFQLHWLKSQHFDPTIAIITNLSPNHLNWHRTVLHYYESKRHLLRYQEPGHWAILNYNDPTLREWKKDSPGKLLWSALEDCKEDNAAFISRKKIHGELQPCFVVRRFGVETALAAVTEQRLAGSHNLENALQACAAGFLYNQELGAISKGLAEFSGLPHRLEIVGFVKGRRLVNDSIATTPESTEKALSAYPDKRVLILGGSDKGLSFDNLAVGLSKHPCPVILLGDMAANIRQALTEAGFTGEIIDAGNDFYAAINLAINACPLGGTVLLSPACASFDMFKNFEERGDKFRQYAQQHQYD